PTKVHPPQGRRGAIADVEERFTAFGILGREAFHPAVCLRKPYGGHHLVALALAFFFIGGNACGAPRADLLNTVEGEQRAAAIEQGVTVDAALAILVLIEMGIATGRTETRAPYRQLRRRCDTLLIANTKDRLPHPVGAALMVDNGLRAELRETE